jgi:DNA-binding transcriptional regulator YiaG
MHYSGADLRASREAAHLTLLAVSRQSRIHRNTLWRWEGMAQVPAGKADLYLKAVRDLATGTTAAA